jgi:anti-sigma factor RsiW
MDKTAPLSDDDREDLIAYLDGELDAGAAEGVEARLTRDPALRAEADTLKRAWDLLDYLPRAEPSTSFTHRTMERLAPVKTASLRLPRWRPWALGIGWAAAVFLFGVGGYAGMRHFQAAKSAGADEELVRDLRVIDNLRLYRHVEDMSFLTQLDHPDLFGDEHPES